MQPESRRLDWRWVTLIGVVLVALSVGAVLWLNRATPAGQSTPTMPGSTATTTPSERPSPDESRSSIGATASPSVTTAQSPYCIAFGEIKAGGVSTGSDDEGVDFGKLSDKFADLIKKYSAAADVAPPTLKDDYTTVLGYLKQAKRAVDSRNLEQIKTMVKNLSSLNDSMDSIQTQSEQLCG